MAKKPVKKSTIKKPWPSCSFCKRQSVMFRRLRDSAGEQTGELHVCWEHKDKLNEGREKKKPAPAKKKVVVRKKK